MKPGGAGAKPVRIALLEHCGTGNLGDDATVEAVQQHIERRWPDAAIIGLSLDPADSERRHGVPAYPIRQSVYPFKKVWTSEPDAAPGRFSALKASLKERLSRHRLLLAAAKTLHQAAIVKPARFFGEIAFLAKSLQVASGLDLLIMCGGGQLLDAWGGPWAFPYTLFKWTILARLSGARCLFLNVGAGPLRFPLSKWFIRRALALADHISFRDAKSQTLIREIGFSGKTEVTADSVYGLKLPKVSAAAERAGGGLVVGVAPMAYRDPDRYWEKDRAGYERFIGALAEFCARLIRDGHRLRLFSSDCWFDSRAIADLKRGVENAIPADLADRIACEPVRDVNDCLQQLGRVDCYVTCRFHGVVFAHIMNVPVLAIAHHPKVSTLMADFGMSEYAVGIDECDPDRLMEKFNDLSAHLDEIKLRTRRNVERCRRVLDLQYDRLFPAEAARTGGRESVGRQHEQSGVRTLSAGSTP